MITNINIFKKIYETFNPNIAEFLEKMKALENEYKDKGVLLELQTSYFQSIYISKIVVPKDNREQGIGSAFMKALTTLADEYGVILTLSPANTYGGTVSRLKKFYNRFGFVDNKGRKKDYRFLYEMIRIPKE